MPARIPSRAVSKTYEQIFFPRADAKLRRQIDDGSVPFLGLYADTFEASWRSTVSTWLAGQHDRLAGVAKLLQQWPALGAAYLMAHVVESYGGEQGYAVYPALATALDVPEATLGGDGPRRQLWNAFRLACLRLRLDVLDRCAGNGYMVAEYRHQAGLSLACAERLGTEMAMYARLAGLPDDDDPAGIRLWRDGLLERPALLASTREALLHDAGDYYVRAFLRALREPEAADAPGIVRALARGYTARQPADSATLRRPLAVPQVRWRDGILVVELPATAAGSVHTWCIDYAGTTLGCPADSDSRPVPLVTDDGALPDSVQVTAMPHGLQRRFPLWADGRGNRLLAFDADGVLVAACRLGSEEQWLAAGDYTVVSRFRPQGREDEVLELESDCALYEWPLTLGPGECVEIRHGPAVLTFRAPARPRLACSGQVYRDVNGHVVFAQTGLMLDVTLPVGTIAGDLPAAELSSEHELTLSLRGGPVLGTLPLRPDATGRCREPLAVLLDAAPAGPAPLLAELRRSGQARVLARQVTTVWIGLEAFDAAGALICRRPPRNRADTHDDNLEVRPLPGGGCRLAAADGGRRSFRIGYSVGDERVCTLVWPVTGVFASLLDYGVTPVQEQALPAGGRLALRRDSRAVLDIATGAAGELRFGAHRYAVAASGQRRLPVATLAEALGPDADTLSFTPAGTTRAIPVLRLVMPHRTLTFEAGKPTASTACRYTLADQSTVLHVSALNIIDGRTLELALLADDPSCCATAPAWLLTERLDDGAWQHTLKLVPERWSPGAWVLSVDAEVQGRRARLLDADGNACGIGLLLDSQGRRTTCLDLPGTLSAAQRLAMLGRAHIALQSLPCVARRADLAWLPKHWQSLARGFAHPDIQTLTRLLALSQCEPTGEHTGTGSDERVPQHVLGSVLPELYTRPAADYAGLGDGPFAALAAVHKAPADVYGQRLSQVAAVGLANCAQVNAGARPQEFAFERYARALASAGAGSRRPAPDWRPRGADCLGPQHLPWARAMLRARLTNTQASADADARPGHALRLARCMQRQPVGSWLPGLSSALLDPRPVLGSPVSGAVPEEAVAIEDHLDALAHALALYAGACRLEARVPGTLGRCMQYLEDGLPDTTPDQHQAALGWLLAAGRELFAFYLLLWELALSTEMAEGVPAWSATAIAHP